ncbi:MAG: ATP-binding protein [Myxococcota bacterium]
MSDPKPEGLVTLTTDPPSEDSSLVLVVLAGDEPGRRFPVGQATLIMGRDPTCDIPVNDRRVSRQHARIEPEDDGSFLLVDNGSSNGTLVNGERIDRRHIDIGDRIGLGRGVVLMFTRSGRFDDQLIQAQKLQALGHLSGRIAHDFNNILTTILTNVSFLRRADPMDPADLKDAIADIELAARAGADLTEGLLSFAHKGEPVQDTVNITNVVQESERLIRRTLGEKVRFSVTVDEDLFVFGHHQQLVNVLLNLAINANDAMPNGGRLTIRAFSEDVQEHRASADWMIPGQYIAIVVEDTGIGMNEATRRRIFEPFFTTKGERGTGMGLASVYGIIREHGGNIRVTSREGVGTVFRIDIPAIDS